MLEIQKVQKVLFLLPPLWSELLHFTDAASHVEVGALQHRQAPQTLPVCTSTSSPEPSDEANSIRDGQRWSSWAGRSAAWLEFPFHSLPDAPGPLTPAFPHLHRGFASRTRQSITKALHLSSFWTSPGSCILYSPRPPRETLSSFSGIRDPPRAQQSVKQNPRLIVLLYQCRVVLLTINHPEQGQRPEHKHLKHEVFCKPQFWHNLISQPSIWLSLQQILRFFRFN